MKPAPPETHAAEPGHEVWKCSPGDVLLTADHAAGTGTATMAGLPRRKTVFSVTGPQRVWKWFDPRGWFEPDIGHVFAVVPAPLGSAVAIWGGYQGEYYFGDASDAEEMFEGSMSFACSRTR